MIYYFNNIITFILWLDFLSRYFPNYSYVIANYFSNIMIYFYSYLELQYKINNIDIFEDDTPLIIDQNKNDKSDVEIDVDNEINKNDIDTDQVSQEILDIIIKHKKYDKLKFS